MLCRYFVLCAMISQHPIVNYFQNRVLILILLSNLLHKKYHWCDPCILYRYANKNTHTPSPWAFYSFCACTPSFSPPKVPFVCIDFCWNNEAPWHWKVRFLLPQSCLRMVGCCCHRCASHYTTGSYRKRIAGNQRFENAPGTPIIKIIKGDGWDFSLKKKKKRKKIQQNVDVQEVQSVSRV